MPITVLMPALSPTMTEGNLVKWHKKEGDSVVAGDILAEIETDKATMEVEAVDEGILGKILISEGTEAVKVNTPIALIAEEGESIDHLTTSLPSSPIPKNEVIPPLLALSTEKTFSNSEHKMSLEKASSSKRLFITPLAKRLAQQKNIDLKGIQGSGPNGRIIKQDIDRYKPGSSAVSMGSNENLFKGLNVNSEISFEDFPLSGMRKVIAKRLTESKQQIPHFYLSMDHMIDDLLELRKKINEATNEKISVNDFMIKAVALALKKTPVANIAYVEGKIRQYHQSDIAVAVAIDGGLVTPILRNAESKSISQLSAEMKLLATRARVGKLMPEEYQGGSFSISNLGMFGVKNFQAIINPPQACILAIGAGEQKPIMRDNNITIGTVMNCTLSLDHRVIDGATGAQFLACLKEFIHTPLTLLI